MPPTSAQGAISALRDASILAEELAVGGMDADSISRYQEQMRVYAKAAIVSAEKGSALLFGMLPYAELKTLVP